MRLRIIVKRHGLPDVPVVLPIDTETAAPTISRLLEAVNDLIPIESGEWGFEDYAVEVRGNIGINYECLHYQEVGKIMREEDEVIIRPLLTHDLKIRKLSGRHQISADGKHLIDGLAFGRPLLRRPADRPPVNIPPRKRARITYDTGIDDDDDQAQLAFGQAGEALEKLNRELIIHADFDDDGEDEVDQDFAPGDEEDDDEEDGGDTETDENRDEERREEKSEDSDQESSSSKSIDDLPGYVSDQEEAEEQLVEYTEGGNPQVESAEDAEQALVDVLDESMRKKIRALHSTFPLSALAVCKHVLIGTNGDAGEAYEALLGGFKPSKPKSAVLGISEAQRKLRVPKTRSRTAHARKDTPAEDLTEDADGFEDPLVEYYDENSLPEVSTTSGQGLSLVAEAVERAPSKRLKSSGSISAANHQSASSALEPGLSRGLTSTPFVDLESQHDESNDEDSDTTNSDEATSSSGDNSSSESPSDDGEKSDTSSSGSDSDSSSDSSSDDEAAPEETSSKTTSVPAPIVDKTEKPGGSDMKLQPQHSTRSARGHGLKSTQERNRRRRTLIGYRRCLKNGELPADTTITEFKQLGIVGGNAEKERGLTALNALRASKLQTVLGEATAEAQSKAEDFEARRKVLLASLGTGGVDLDDKALDTVKEQQLPNQPSPVLPSAKESGNISHLGADVTSTSSRAQTSVLALGDARPGAETADDNVEPTTAIEDAALELSITNSCAASAPSTQGTSTSSRRRLDLNAGRRLLFGALGIKTPKTKKDEENLRADLMKDIKPVLPPKEVPTVTVSVTEMANEEDPDAWRQRITYRAVECCDEDVVLSEPPFPFVQRWDPQQQGSWSQKGNRGGKRKQDQRGQSQLNERQGPSKKQKRRKGKHSYAEEQEILDLNYDESFQDSVMETQNEDQYPKSLHQREDLDREINQQLMNDLAAPADDASQGPSDLATLPPNPTVLPDLSVGYAKIGMTIAFKQLCMSAATNWQPEISDWRTAIVVALPEPEELHLKLAVRDRMSNKKNFDEETGERIYSKFEVPDDDDDDADQEDIDLLTLSYGDLVSPKILQDAPADLLVSGQADDEHRLDYGPSTDDSTTMGHEEQGQDSHVTETPFQSDAPEPVVDTAGVVIQSTEARGNGIEHDNEAQVGELRTPAVAASLLETDLETMSEPISDENRKEISLLMREAGFRSSVPSSVLRDMQLNDEQIPGDDAVFEELMRDMTEVEGNNEHSPTFHSLGSSPPPKMQPEFLKSPSPDDVSSQVEEQEPSQPTPERVAIIMPSKIQSSWETVISGNDEIPSSPLDEVPEVVADEPSSWEDEPSSPSIKVFTRVDLKAKAKKSAKKIPISRPQPMWEALQPEKRKSSTASSAKSSMTSQGPSQAPSADDSRDGHQSVEYPKLAVGSSSTTQNTEGDHGRQPDFSYDDTALETDIPEAVVNSVDSARESVLPNGKSKIRNRTSNSVRCSSYGVLRLSSPEPESGSQRPSVSRNSYSPINQSRSNQASNSDSSSNDPFPTMDELLSQRSSKSEQKRTKSGKTYSKISAQTQAATKATQKNGTPRKCSPVKAASQTTPSESTGSQLIALQTKIGFVPPAGSQIMDLTLSSDVEPNADEEAEMEDDQPSDDSESYLRKFRKYDSDLDNDDFEEPGWKAKKATSLKGVETRTQTSVGLRTSSQNSISERGKGRGSLLGIDVRRRR